jgi:hypothetical protein
MEVNTSSMVNVFMFHDVTNSILDLTRVYLNASVVTASYYSFMLTVSNVTNNMLWNDAIFNHTFTSVSYAYVFSQSMTTARLNINALILLVPANVTNGNTFSIIYTLLNGTFTVPEIALVLGTSSVANVIFFNTATNSIFGI